MIRLVILAVILAASPAQAQIFGDLPPSAVAPFTMPAIEYPNDPRFSQRAPVVAPVVVQKPDRWKLFQDRLQWRCKTVRCRNA